VDLRSGALLWRLPALCCGGTHILLWEGVGGPQYGSVKADSRSDGHSPPRRGGVAARSIKKPRSHLIQPRRGGRFGAIQGFAGLTTPSAPFKGGFAIFLLMSRPPLLYEEGNCMMWLLLRCG
jgi:hypothetical protein